MNVLEKVIAVDVIETPPDIGQEYSQGECSQIRLFTGIQFCTAIARKRVRVAVECGQAAHIRCQADRDDVVQDALLDIVTHLSTSPITESDPAILKRQLARVAGIAAKRAIWPRRQPTPEPFCDLAPPRGARVFDRRLNDISAPEPEQSAAASQKQQLAVIGTLPDRLQLPAVLVAFRGLSRSAVAKLQGKTLRCVKLWLAEIRAALEARIPRRPRREFAPAVEPKLASTPSFEKWLGVTYASVAKRSQSMWRYGFRKGTVSRRQTGWTGVSPTPRAYVRPCAVDSGVDISRWNGRFYGV